MPDRIDLEPATDVFRITGEGIEFVDMETNTIDQKKSAAFTKVLRDKGFSFPGPRRLRQPLDAQAVRQRATCWWTTRCASTT